MIQANSPRCQVAIYSGYSQFWHPATEEGIFRRKKKKEKKQVTIKDHYVNEALNKLLVENDDENETEGKRKKITHFTKRSRLNLQKKLYSLSEFPSLFITLTYPKFYPADSKEWKRHEDNFRKRFLKKFPGTWYCWKLEPQRRGAPHYHLLCDLGCKVNIVLLRKYVSQLWYEVCGKIDPKHLKAGTQVQQVQGSEKAIKSYLYKYISKIDTTVYEEWRHPGRFWGIAGRKNFPDVMFYNTNVDESDLYVIRRLIRRWLKRQSRSSWRYAKRLAHIPTFFVFIPSIVVHRLLDLVHGPPPF